MPELRIHTARLTCDAHGCTAREVETADTDLGAHQAVIAKATARGWLLSLDRGESNKDYCVAHRRFAP